MKRLILIWLCILFFGGFDSKGQSCESTNLVHYQYNDIKNILEKNSCLNCHHGINNGWSFDTYRNMFSSGKCGSVIKPGSPATSILVDRLNGGAVDCGNPIPLAAHTIPSKDLLAIETWILVGAPEFCIPEYEEVKISSIATSVRIAITKTESGVTTLTTVCFSNREIRFVLTRWLCHSNIIIVFYTKKFQDNPIYVDKKC
ncbi:MAG: hypothetical protein IPK25_09130 [Saprospiraceae bacterium]|nr:hypothetical protein [Saprospiraceae bacterium]